MQRGTVKVYAWRSTRAVGRWSLSVVGELGKAAAFPFVMAAVVLVALVLPMYCLLAGLSLFADACRWLFD